MVTGRSLLFELRVRRGCQIIDFFCNLYEDVGLNLFLDPNTAAIDTY